MRATTRARREPCGRCMMVAVNGLLLTASAAAGAADTTAAQGADNSFFAAWFALADAAKEAQPHWMTPIVTVTPRLEQEYRYDQSWQNRPNGIDLTNYGGGKGLEVIPTASTEFILGEPAYQTRDTPKGRVQGWVDESLLLKYRFLARNEESGNYIVTGFLGVSVPTGSEIFTNHTAVYTPTLAVGKGWGTRQAGFDIQSTLGISLPGADLRTLGKPVSWNTALQTHILEKLWPEIEANYVYFKDGPNEGKHQLAFTAGVVLGRFELTRRARLIVGGGYQKTVSSFHTFNHSWVMTGRVAF